MASPTQFIKYYFVKSSSDFVCCVPTYVTEVTWSKIFGWLRWPSARMRLHSLSLIMTQPDRHEAQVTRLSVPQTRVWDTSQQSDWHVHFLLVWYFLHCSAWIWLIGKQSGLVGQTINMARWKMNHVFGKDVLNTFSSSSGETVPSYP